MTEIWLIRHGQSTANAGSTTTTIADAPLTEAGRAQADEVSRSFPRPPGLIITSPYVRAQQSAACACALYPDAAFETWDSFREFAAIGDEKYKGTTVTERIPMMREYWERRDPHHVDGPGAESFLAMCERVSDTLARLAATCAAHDFVAVFTHERVMQMARLLLSPSEMDAVEMLESFPVIVEKSRIPNGGVVRLVIRDGVLRLAKDA